jgi:hypothetical protein
MLSCFVDMGKVLLTLDDAADKKFREVVSRLFGDKKGALSIAGEQAIKEWIQRHDVQLKF